MFHSPFHRCGWICGQPFRQEEWSWYKSRRHPSGWGQFQDVLRAGVSKGNWDTWLSRLEPDFGGETPTLVAPSEFHLRWVRDKHGELIDSAYRDAFGNHSHPVFKVVEPEPGVEPTLPLDDGLTDPTHRVDDGE